MGMETDFALAKASLSANRLRTGLTITIIAIGICSLVGIETAIDVLSSEFTGSFSRMGTGTIVLASSGSGECRPLTLRDASNFKAGWKRDEGLSIIAELDEDCQVSGGGKRTDPVVRIAATDENRLAAENLELSSGRNFSSGEISSSSGTCIIGSSVAEKLFGTEKADGQSIKAMGMRMTVCAVLEKQGALLGGGYDNSVMIPLSAAIGRFISSETEVRLDILCSGEGSHLMQIGEAERLMRAVRRIPAGAETDFSISSGEGLRDKLEGIKGKLSIAALVTGLITLLGASVALMNILLVSVKERTGEIGLRKALGERVSSIRKQFLLEAVLIGQIGGAIGIAAGILAGNAVALILDSNFAVPWLWLARAVAICLAVSVLSGSIPAGRAAALNPIDALRCD